MGKIHFIIAKKEKGAVVKQPHGMENGFLSALYKRWQGEINLPRLICFYVVDILQSRNQKHSGNDFIKLRLYFQFMSTYCKKQILQLMQVFYFSE